MPEIYPGPVNRCSAGTMVTRRNSGIFLVSSSCQTIIMSIKYNESTHNRPDGERVLDARFVFSDIAAYTEQLKDEKAWKHKDRNAITVFKSSGLTIVLQALKKGAEVPDNELSGFFSVQLVEGKADVMVESQLVQLTKGILVLHPKVKHSVKASG
ncbi:MAG: hypothetical protein EOO81_04220, partial [Oxalobacteraceae bacterium]